MDLISSIKNNENHILRENYSKNLRAELKRSITPNIFFQRHMHVRFVVEIFNFSNTQRKRMFDILWSYRVILALSFHYLLLDYILGIL